MAPLVGAVCGLNAAKLPKIAFLQNVLQLDPPPIRTALITARSSPAHERVIRTLREWKVSIDEAHFLGGAPKAPVLEAFRPHIYFDDQNVHLRDVSEGIRLMGASSPSVRCIFSRSWTSPESRRERNARSFSAE